MQPSNWSASPHKSGVKIPKMFELPPPSWVAGSSPLEFLWLTVDDIEDHASESSRSQDASICKCSGQTACLKGLNGVVSPKKNKLDVAGS